MKPLVEAVVADATGTMKATFFNQPWLERKYRPGRGCCCRASTRAATASASRSTRRRARRWARGRRMATYPGDRRAVLDADPRARARVARRRADALEPLPARLRAIERLPDRAAALDAAHFGDHEGGRRRLAFEELLLLQLALLRRRARRREGARAEPLEPPAG